MACASTIILRGFSRDSRRFGGRAGTCPRLALGTWQNWQQAGFPGIPNWFANMPSVKAHHHQGGTSIKFMWQHSFFSRFCVYRESFLAASCTKCGVLFDPLIKHLVAVLASESRGKNSERYQRHLRKGEKRQMDSGAGVLNKKGLTEACKSNGT
uniref:Uncharacterized protein n=1 Tax=Oryza meridionalis TaxID=40149 RepID=A0A0E0DSV1_9ORYZ